MLTRARFGSISDAEQVPIVSRPQRRGQVRDAMTVLDERGADERGGRRTPSNDAGGGGRAGEQRREEEGGQTAR